MSILNSFLKELQKMANDNRYHYGRWNSKHGNGLGNVEDPLYFDCCTSISYCIYKAFRWKWASQKYGYYWPHVSEGGFDYFLTHMLHLKKCMWSDNMQDSLQPGDILISSETYGHTVCYVGEGYIFDANNSYEDDIAIRKYYNMEWLYCYRWINDQEDIIKMLQTLKKGSKGNQVKNLQALLNLWLSKSEPLIIDGYFGEVTEIRLKRYQELQGLYVDGICAEKTWKDILVY